MIAFNVTFVKPVKDEFGCKRQTIIVKASGPRQAAKVAMAKYPDNYVCEVATELMSKPLWQRENMLYDQRPSHQKKDL